VEGNNNIAIAAHELGARTRRAWIYRGVNVNVLEGQVGAITGPAGSGRTSLLLALAARMPFTTGSLRVCGHGLPEGASSVRSAVAVARAGGANDLEPELRVRDHLIERGVRGDREALFDKACGRLGLTVDRYALAGDLAAGPAALLCLALALLDEPRIVLLDDLDRGLPGAEQSELWQRMRALTEDGVTVLATSTDSTPAHGWADILIDLTGVAS
jgi:ABC-2 type transport system ATP-binding protein